MIIIELEKEIKEINFKLNNLIKIIDVISNTNFKGDIKDKMSIDLSRYGKGCISFRPKENKYMGRVYDKINKKQICVYSRNKEECYNKLKTIRKLLINNDRIIKTSFNSWIDEWLKTYKVPTVSKNTLKSYENVINKHIKPFAKDFLLTEPSIKFVELLNSIQANRQKEIAYNILNDCLKQATLNKLIKENPIEIIKKPKNKSIKGIALTKQQQEDFINYLEKTNTTYRNILLMYLYTGARREELTNIKWSQIDFKEKTIHLKGTKTYGSDRIIPLFRKCEEILKNMDNTTTLIFNISNQTITRKAKEIFDILKIENITLHSLRHTFATRCLENNINPKVLQKWLGHSTLEMTMNTYSHVQNELEKENIKKINEIN